MELSYKILLLLWFINFAPPFLAYLLEDKWNFPLDGGLLLRDGKPLLGAHKTFRGVCAAFLTGIGLGSLLGFPWWEGFFVAGLSTLGDLLSSFLKRRAGQASGSVVAGLDQAFEASLPFAFLAPRYALSGLNVFVLVLLFSIPAFLGSWFFKKVLSQKPYEGYPRKVSPRVRLRELRACEIAYDPLHRILNFENAIYYHLFMKGAFRMLGFYPKGLRNALRVGLRRFTFHFQDLPQDFDGYTLLFLSDLHLDGLEGLAECLQDLVKTLSVDVCILGGDLRMEMFGSCKETLVRTMRLAKCIRSRDGIFAVLGNHDCVEMIPELEKEGIRVLLNDSNSLEREGSRIWLVGIDDPHYYRCHDLDLAFSGVPGGAFSIFVAHSPEVYREAAGFGARLYLCGHTHAGQIQIPRLGPVFTHSRAPRRLSCGVWNYHGMTGLTSSGAGVSGVPVRFFTQGEVAHITLLKAPP